MDSSEFNQYSGKGKREDAIHLGSKLQPLYPSGDAKRIPSWESLIAEIIDDVVDGCSIDVMRFDTCQEGE